MFPLVYTLYFSEIFYLIFKVFIYIPTMRKSNFLCSLSYDYRKLFLQSFDANFSSLELLVTDISAVLLVYPLCLQMFCFFYSLSSLKYSIIKKDILFIYPLHGYRILS